MYTEGFIHRKTLPEDYYDIADAGMSLVGKHLGWHFTVGMTIEASILKVDIASGGVGLRWFAGGNQYYQTIQADAGTDNGQNLSVTVETAT